MVHAELGSRCSTHSMRPWLVTAVVTAAAAGLVIAAFISLDHNSCHDSTPSWYIKARQTVLGQPGVVPEVHYRVLGPAVWPKTVWGKCTLLAASSDVIGHISLPEVSPGQQALCQLPSVWKDCSAGIYIDVGTNVGAQLRKLYDPSQFPGASVLPLFDATYGTNRSRVCAIGVEANPAHTPYLQKLNAYFRRMGYQAIVLTETAASIKSGKATLHLDHGSPVEWGASLSQGSWQINSANSTNEAVVSLLDLPAFVSDVVRPILRQDQYERAWLAGRQPPSGMKLDVEGEEYALLPALITSGGLCDLSLIFMELHPPQMRTPDGLLVDMTPQAMEDAFAKMRKANPRCTVQYTHLDDESYLHADTEVPLPTDV